MAETYKRLAQGRLPASNGTTKLYDVPSSTQAIIKSINISNNTSTAREVTLHHTDNDASSLVDADLILPGVSIFKLVVGQNMTVLFVWLQLQKFMGLHQQLMKFLLPSGA